MRVCIIGSGLSALTLAKALVNHKIYVDVVHQKKIHKINQSRTLSISRNNLDYLNKNIINTRGIAWKLKKIEIFSENLQNEKILNFENNKDQLFSIIKNYEFLKVLNKDLSNNKYCKKILFKKKLLDIEGYNLVINTDYSNLLTKKYFNKKIYKSYNSLAYTTIIKHKKISNNVATQIFTKKGPIAFLPISENETSIVYSFHKTKNNCEDKIVELIYKYNFRYKIKKISKIESFELKSIILRSYYNRKILAFGDILHRIHPLAGQGFNMTIRDIITFIDIIKKKIDLGLPLDYSVNAQFEKKIKHKNYIFTSGVDLIYEFFNLERKLNNNILSKSLKFLGKNSSINKMFIKIADKGIIL